MYSQCSQVILQSSRQLSEASVDLEMAIKSFRLLPLKFDPDGSRISDAPPVLRPHHDNVHFVEHLRYIASLRKRITAVTTHGTQALIRRRDALVERINDHEKSLEAMKSQQWLSQFSSDIILDPCKYEHSNNFMNSPPV